MALTLGARLDAHIAALTTERQRIIDQAKANVADVDKRLSALTQAKAVITANTETAYATLVALGLIQEIS